jgi:hypothetical protein
VLDFWLFAAFFACRHGRRPALLLPRAPPVARRQDRCGSARHRRIAAVIFGAIIVGALLALLVGYLVFFSGLAPD